MTNLIKVTYENERPTVMGRDLHNFLGVTERYSSWFERMQQYGFAETIDYLGCKVFNTLAKQELQDHQLTIEMAKEISMLQRNEKGKQARQYFIQLEKEWNSPEKVMARALKIADKKIQCLEIENLQQKQMLAEFSPKASYYDVVLQTPDVVSATQIAKDYGKSAIWLNNILHENKVQFKQGGVWLLYQKYADKGYTKSKTEVYNGSDGKQHSRIHTYWTQKGRLFIYDLLKGVGIYPLIEQDNIA